MTRGTASRSRWGRIGAWLGRRRKSSAGGPDPAVAEIGWLIDFNRARLVFDAPRPLLQKRENPPHAKSVDLCPAVLEHQSRTFEIRCPFDLRLRIEGLQSDAPRVVNLLGKRSPVSAANLSSLVVLNGRDTWRHPDRPLIQIAAPWRFVADDPVWMTQLPAYAHYREPPLPGVVISGRLPIHVWPRILMWAFEWHDASRDLVLRRGQPWFYLAFETTDPAQKIRLVEARMTPELRDYCQGIDGVAGFVRGTQRLYRTAERRRPARLLSKRAETPDH